MFCKLLAASRMDSSGHGEASVKKHFCPGPSLGKAELARVFRANLHGNSERKSFLTQISCLA